MLHGQLCDVSGRTDGNSLSIVVENKGNPPPPVHGVAEWGHLPWGVIPAQIGPGHCRYILPYAI